MVVVDAVAVVIVVNQTVSPRVPGNARLTSLQLLGPWEPQAQASSAATTTWEGRARVFGTLASPGRVTSKGSIHMEWAGQGAANLGCNSVLCNLITHGHLHLSSAAIKQS